MVSPIRAPRGERIKLVHFQASVPGKCTILFLSPREPVVLRVMETKIWGQEVPLERIFGTFQPLFASRPTVDRNETGVRGPSHPGAVMQLNRTKDARKRGRTP